MYWRIEGEEIVVALDLQTFGVWMGWGISVNGGMEGADLAVARYFGNFILQT